ncbi:hypothetical protein K0U83_24820 [bacterium]|jgi:hypothetical protein|nr:hypothetical protein [bacterium]
MTKSDWEGLAQSESTLIHKEEPTARARDLRTKKSPERMQAVIDNIRDGQPITRAARLAGLNPDTVHRWRKEDEEFDEAVEDALEFQIAVLTAKVDRASDTDWKAAAWRLERLRPDEFGSKKEVSVTATQSNGLAEVIAMIEQTNDSVKPQEDP